MIDKEDMSSASLITARDVALGQLEFCRAYTRELLDAIPHERWYEMPPGCATNAIWQAGHLAVAEYGLLLFRQRGRQPEDLELVPGPFRKRYGRGSTPSPDPEHQATPEQALQRWDAIFAQALRELPAADPEQLREPVEMPYAVYPNRLGALLFCPLHIQIHAGQIGALRRSLGLAPIR